MFDIVIGIDPGLGGAVSILDLRGNKLIAKVFYTPLKTIIKNKKKKKDKNNILKRKKKWFKYCIKFPNVRINIINFNYWNNLKN